ncbi:MAG: hypothetical protein CMJ58_20630 [Planctomycetaceae bacterium]|nr:hypothetical protein [Planctomycetaceae bacterium]
MHEVICFQNDDTVCMLDDSRGVVHSWPTLQDFIDSLTIEPEREASDPSGIIEDESYLDF